MRWIKNAANKFESFRQGIQSYIDPSAELEPQNEVEQSIRSGVSFKGSQLLVLVFAIFIASLGLNTNSIPVIIGAMLISPLMGPIIGMGLGIGIQDFELLKKSLRNILAAVVGSLIASAVYFMISPQYEGSSQLLARTSPSIYDVFVALFGGAAGILSIACKNKGQVMPGVAIATSLMPPLCTAGYGLATLQGTFFFGALYLFFTNMIFILFATWIGVKMFRFKKVVYNNAGRTRRIQRIVYFFVTMTVIISAFLTFRMIEKNIFINKATQFVEKEMVFPNTQVLNQNIYVRGGERHINVTLIGAALPKDSLQLAMLNKLDSLGLGGTILTIKQGFSMSSPEFDEEKNLNQFYSLMQTELARKDSQIDSLRQLVSRHQILAHESASLSPELHVLFPSINDIAFSEMVSTQLQENISDTVNMVFVNAPSGLRSGEREKLMNFLKIRLKQDRVNILVNPSNFPWPSKETKESRKE